MTKETFIPGVDDAYLEGVKRWQEKKDLETQKKEHTARVEQERQETKKEAKRKRNLTLCKTCAKEVSKTAKKCPHCGETLRWGFGKKLVAGAFIGVVGMFVIGKVSGPYVPIHDTVEAQLVIKNAIVSRLKDPDSFKEIQSKVTEKNGIKLVFIEYTATNSFNARVRDTAIGIVDQNGKILNFKPNN